MNTDKTTAKVFYPFTLKGFVHSCSEDLYLAVKPKNLGVGLLNII